MRHENVGDRHEQPPQRRAAGEPGSRRPEIVQVARGGVDEVGCQDERHQPDGEHEQMLQLPGALELRPTRSVVEVPGADDDGLGNREREHARHRRDERGAERRD